jgi:sigma-B regulation protein RsbU (phosphoserine phosphatase)
MNRLLLDYQCTAELAAAGQLRKLLRQVLVSSVQEKSLHHKILLCLSEIVSNIARYNQPTASQISVRFEQTEQNWELRISDNGNCYDPARHEVQDLAEVHPDSESGRGIALILACCDRIDYLPGDADKPNLTVCSWTSNRQKNRRRILIVEDEATSRRLYTHYLNELYEVFEARNGEEAMEVLGSADIDLILSDINMPGMDGLTLRSEITQNPEYELIPFVFLTASEDDDLCGRAASLGIDDYLIKPVNKENLVKRIERVLQRNRQVLDQLSNRFNRKISESYAITDPERLPHWTIAVKRRGTGAGGGDLLLSQAVPEGSLIALIDIMGHDETAKFFSYAYGGFISGMMQSAPESGMGCHELLRQLSHTAYNDELLSKATLTGVAFELGPQGMVTMASAAHPQPLLVSPESIESIPVEGILPGLLPDSEYSPVKISVKSGERIAIYTDGLLESAPDNQSRARLESEILTAIKDTLNLPIDRASRFIMQIFDEIAGTPPRDDTTFILLEPDFHSTEAIHAR